MRTLNQEVKDLKEKLEEEDHQKDKEQKAKVTVEKELTALLGQVETAKDDAMKEFRASQAFIDSCAKYYGDGFEDYLKQVKSLYPHLNFSKVSMDDPLPSTLAGDTFEENDDSFEFEANPEDDDVILAQPALDKPVVPMTRWPTLHILKILQLKRLKTFLPRVMRSQKILRPPELRLFLCKFVLNSGQFNAFFFFYALFVKTLFYL